MKFILYLAAFANVFSFFPAFGEGVQPSLKYELVQDHPHPTNPRMDIKMYKFSAQGFPREAPLILSMKKLDGQVDSMNAKLDYKEDLLTESRKEYNLAIGRCAYGEPFEMTLTDGKDLKAFVVIVPKEIRTQDSAGHELTLTMQTRNGEIFLLEASGFQPNEKLTLCSISNGEINPGPINATEEGKVACFLAPAVIGSLSGKASIQIEGKTTDNLRLEYVWGLDAFK